MPMGWSGIGARNFSYSLKVLKQMDDLILLKRQGASLDRRIFSSKTR
jgi:hypothetical protein